MVDRTVRDGKDRAYNWCLDYGGQVQVWCDLLNVGAD